MRALLGVLSTLAFAVTGAASALASETARSPVVLELFTSQGCSSCPSADRLLKSYIDRKDVMALSFSVDYWDYLGWKDTLANPKFTKRQREYAAHQAGGQVYTPQLVVDGVAHAVGSDRGRIDGLIEASRKKATGGRVRLVAADTKDAMTVEVGAGQVAPDKPGIIWVAIVEPRVEVTVTRGENRGRSLDYHNVVRDLIPVGKWTGQAMTLRLERQSMMSKSSERCAVLLQSGKGGEILAAAWFE